MRRMPTTLSLSLLLIAATLAPVSAAETWHIDPGHSNATFSVRHLVISTVRGVVPIREGSITTAGSSIPVAVAATLDASKIASGNDNRDSDLRGKDWLEVDKYPTMTFKSTKITAGADASTFAITGDLTIHAVTKSVTLNAKFFGTTTDARGHKHAGYEASVTIDRRAFGLNWAHTTPGGDLVAGNEVEITLDVEAVAAG
jgi:polyisoprenoid-binding protein YceI